MKKYISIFLLLFIFSIPLLAQEDMYVMRLGSNWEIEGDLPVHAMLVS